MRPIVQVARDLGINEGTLGNWVNADKRRRGDGNGALGEDERAALEAGFRRGRGDILVTIDSDSVIEPDTLLAMTGPFATRTACNTG